MSKLNRLKFEEYDEIDYLKIQIIGESHFKVISKFPKGLGFNSKTSGFIVIHKRHSASGLESEIPACLVLKNLGYRVELVEEHPHIASLDVRINDILFEMKRFVDGKDLLAGVTKHFRKTYHKTDKMALHIDKKVELSSIKRTLRIASEKYPTIKTVLLIYEKQAIELDKEMMRKGNYWL